MQRVLLSRRDEREIADLYVWGARTQDLADLYNISPRGIRHVIVRRGITPRSTGRPHKVRSIPLLKREGDWMKRALYEDVDQLVRSCVRSRRDTHIALRLEDVSKHSYLEVASGSRYAFLRTDSRRQDL